ncbi:hypothetical protein D3C85_1117750 [compost metagenome]
MRARYGSDDRLRAKIGSNRYSSCCHRALSGSRIDTAGSRLTWGMENSSTRPMASRKPGVALRKISADRPKRSRRLSRRRARLTPMLKASGTTSTSTPASSARVLPKRLKMIAATGWLESRETPRSPRSTWPSQLKYCTRIGRFRPSCSRRVSTLSSGASGPRMTRAGSEGSAWVAMNTTRLMTQAVSRP